MSKIPEWIDTFCKKFSDKNIIADNETQNDELQNDNINTNDEYAIDTSINDTQQQDIDNNLNEINIDDLPSITWNDVVYHVLFKNNKAYIYNSFKNLVTTLENTNDMTEVSNKLNGQQIASLASIETKNDDDDFEDEIEKTLNKTNNNNLIEQLYKYVDSKINNNLNEITGDKKELFKQAKCPYCNKQLIKTNINENTIDIECNCGKKYLVNLKTEQIFEK